MADPVSQTDADRAGFVSGLGLWDSTMIVAGSMNGSGIFILSADIAPTGMPVHFLWRRLGMVVA
jgi:amino acid transporter